MAPGGFETVIVSDSEVVGSLPNTEYMVCYPHVPMKDAFYTAAPKLKLVQLLSAGYDNVDLEAARRAKVPLSNNGGANAISVAEHALMLMLTVYRKVVWQHGSVSGGRWRGNGPAPRMYELYDKTLGIIGLGTIGKKVARLGRAFGMRVQYFDIARLSEDEADALGVLDAYGVQTAHLVGLSMGGGIAQDIALRCPDRVESLTLICTSPAVPGDPGSPALPPPAEHIQALFAAPPPDPDWSDREAVIQWFLNTEKAFAGSIPADDNRIRAIAGQAYDRTTNMAASQNHWRLGGEVLDADPAPRSLAEITAPALILHGTEDPLFPYPHGEALAARIPDARLVPLEGGGHQMPAPEVWDTVITEILRHTSSDRRLRG